MRWTLDFFFNVTCRILVSQAGTVHDPWQLMGFPGGTSGKEPTSQCRRHKRCVFNPWVWKIPWRRKWKPTSVFLLEKSHGRRNLVGYNPWGGKESDMTERLHFHFTFISLLLFGMHAKALEFSSGSFYFSGAVN